jgi:hypothetical protein
MQAARDFDDSTSIVAPDGSIINLTTKPQLGVQAELKQLW